MGSSRISTLSLKSMSLERSSRTVSPPERVAVGFIRSSPEKSIRPSSPEISSLESLSSSSRSQPKAVVPGRITPAWSCGR